MSWCREIDRVGASGSDGPGTSIFSGLLPGCGDSGTDHRMNKMRGFFLLTASDSRLGMRRCSPKVGNAQYDSDTEQETDRCRTLLDAGVERVDASRNRKLKCA